MITAGEIKIPSRAGGMDNTIATDSTEYRYGLNRPAVCRQKDRGVSGSRSLGESLAIFVILDVEKARALFRQPALAHDTLERAPVSIDGPHVAARGGKVMEVTAASAALVDQPRSAGCGPVEHLDRKVVGLPIVHCCHLFRASTGQVANSKLSLGVHYPVSGFAVL